MEVNTLQNIKEACYNLDPESRMCTDIELMNAPFNPENPIYNSGIALVAIELSGAGDNQRTAKVYACGHSSDYGGYLHNGVFKQGGASVCSGGTSVVACCK